MFNIGVDRKMRIRLLEEKDFEAFRTLFDEAYSEYLEFLKYRSNEQFLEAAEEREEVTGKVLISIFRQELVLWLKKEAK